MSLRSHRSNVERRLTARSDVSTLRTSTHRPLAVSFLIGLAAVTGTPLAAQSADTSTISPAARLASRRFAAEWLQASSGPIGRHALPSLAGAFSRPLGGATSQTQVEFGWLRAARPTTTAQGITAGIARPLSAGRLTVRPGLAVLAGQAISTVDSGGYDWRGISAPYLGQSGYQDRPRLTRGATVGAGLQLGADLALFRGLHLTGSVRQWAFSGDVIRANRSPMLAGVGLAFDRAGHEIRQIRAVTRPTVSAKAVSSPVAATQPDSAR